MHIFVAQEVALTPHLQAKTLENKPSLKSEIQP